MSSNQRQVRFRDAAFHAQNKRCFYCEFPMWSADPSAFSTKLRKRFKVILRFQCTAEHLDPVSAGGPTTSSNIVAACKFCNQTRHKMGTVLKPEDYRRYVRQKVAARRWHPDWAFHLLE
ncbi:restriction endonuclease [Solimonas sp. K1W22B-7]|uniref:HNH endonuclease n=1 Tax=Solimonas sp. K1W22B-7 TaxID=2303331 RepID=UPI000E335F10|nr:restriction endonuclease [Solimonas sp. K1W22B-7]